MFTGRRRWFLIAGLVVAGLVVLGGWLLHDAFAAKNELQTVRDDVHRLRNQIDAGDFAGAKLTAADITRHAQAAHNDTTGPLWALSANVPFLGRPFDDERTIAQGINRIAEKALPPLIQVSNDLHPEALRQPDGTVNLQSLVSVGPALTTAASTMQSALKSITALPGSSWLGSADRARSDVIAQLQPLTGTITTADTAVKIVPTMLGLDGPKSYMVTFENEAELRGGGGLPGAFGILSANHGTLKFTRFEPDSTLVGVPSGLDLGPGFDQTYDAGDATNDYRDSNVSPNFPYAARIWLAEWQRKTGQTLDGALTIDPTALSYLLGVTGGTTLPDGTAINAGNVVQLTEQEAYAKFTAGQNAQRKQYLLDIARKVSTKLITSTGETTSLFRAAGMAAAQHRLLVFSTDQGIEAQLAETAISGAIPTTTAPFAAIGINNGGANKLDYYLHASTTWVAHGCGTNRTVVATITLQNDAPANVPAYVLGFTGQPGFPQSPGDNLLLLTYYGTSGGQLAGVTVNGQPSTAGSATDLGHPAYTMSVPLARGATTTITFDLVESGKQAPTLWLQPMVNPMTGAASQNCH